MFVVNGFLKPTSITGGAPPSEGCRDIAARGEMYPGATETIKPLPQLPDFYPSCYVLLVIVV